MYRFLKWLVWIAGICFVLIIVVIVAVQIFLSSDEIIRIAEREGRKILGRKVSIERLELGLFKIEASGIVIDGQAEKGGVKSNTPFVRFDDVEILLNPSTLIYKRISILQLNVKSASARVHRDADGRFDFQDIIDKLHRGTNRSASSRGGNTFSFIKSAEAAESVPQGSESGFSFIIHELDLYDVKTALRFDSSDAAPAFDGSCSFAHIEVDKIIPGKPLDVFLDGKCRSPSSQRLIELKGDAHIDMKGSELSRVFRNTCVRFVLPACGVADVSRLSLQERNFCGELEVQLCRREAGFLEYRLKGPKYPRGFSTESTSEMAEVGVGRIESEDRGPLQSAGWFRSHRYSLCQDPFPGCKIGETLILERIGAG